MKSVFIFVSAYLVCTAEASGKTRRKSAKRIVEIDDAPPEVVRATSPQVLQDDIDASSDSEWGIVERETIPNEGSTKKHLYFALIFAFL